VRGVLCQGRHYKKGATGDGRAVRSTVGISTRKCRNSGVQGQELSVNTLSEYVPLSTGPKI
jgi:hypothetical protein